MTCDAPVPHEAQPAHRPGPRPGRGLGLPRLLDAQLGLPAQRRAPVGHPHVPAVRRLARQPARRGHRAVVRVGPDHLARRDADDRRRRDRDRLPGRAGDQPVPLPRPGVLRARAAADPDAPGGGSVHRAVQDDVLAGAAQPGDRAGRALHRRGRPLHDLDAARLRRRRARRPRGGRHGPRTIAPVRVPQDHLPAARPRAGRVGRLRLPPGVERVHRRPRGDDRGAVAHPAAVAAWVRAGQREPGDRLGPGDGGLDARRRARHHLLPHRPGPDEQRARRRGGEGMSLTADAAATLQPGFPGTDVPDWLVRAHAGGVVSVCLYGDNVAGPDGLAGLCAALRERMPGVLLAVDEEGGDVTRLHYPAGSTAVGNAVLGRLDDLSTTRTVAAGIGHELAALGIGLDLAPDVDVNSSPDNPVIGVRSFGDEPGLVARHTSAWVEGLQSTGVAACAKHFPGHGDTVVDSHHGLPRVDVTLEVLHERELAPFRAAVEAGVASVMTSHIVVAALDPHHPATFSRTVIGLLRDDLGFDGVVVSDALDMAGASAETGVPEAAVRALEAGVDLLCLGSATSEDTFEAVHAAVIAAVHAGRLSEDRVAEAASRVRALAGTTAGRMPAPGTGPDTTTAPLPDATVAGAFRVDGRATAWLAAP